MKKKKGRKMTIKIRQSEINSRLSKQINIQEGMHHYPVLEVKDGIATNIDYTNPQHLKWLED